jgi:hypothetical protein
VELKIWTGAAGLLSVNIFDSTPPIEDEDDDEDENELDTRN